MLKTISALIIGASLSGCVAVPAAVVYNGSLTGVNRVAEIYVAETYPTLPVPEASVCMTSNMTRLEVVKLGSQDSQSLSPAYRSAFDEVVTREKVAACLVDLEQTTA